MERSNQTLAAYLRRAGAITGPLSIRVNNSTLSVIKSMLLGHRQEDFEKRYQVFGRELHKRVLEPHKRKKRLTPEEERRLKKMVANLTKHPMFAVLLRDSKKEHLVKGVINGVKVRGTLDVNKQVTREGADPKTTSTANFNAFVKSAFEYGYPRQAWIYKRIANLIDFYFFGIQKFPPHGVFVLDVRRYPQEMAYFEQEAIFLIMFYQFYGKLK